ncbi:MAG: hypothetical protein DRG83_05540 [Deltaproteobacteria bacterium]|nr:MAG: hypothetical protein DRG83_05540 [Deltaproteobacteria bacterium]
MRESAKIGRRIAGWNGPGDVNPRAEKTYGISSKVLLLVNGLVRSYKAYSRNFVRLASVAREYGTSVIVVGLDRPSADQVGSYLEGVRYRLVRKDRPLALVRLLLASLLEIVRSGAGIIVFGSLNTWSFPFYWLLLKVFRNRHVVYYMQDPVPESTAYLCVHRPQAVVKARVWLQQLAERLAVDSASVLLVTCNDVLDAIGGRVDLSRVRIEVAWNTAGIAMLEQYGIPEVEELKRLKKKLRMGDGPKILYSGKQQRGVRGLEQQMRVLQRLLAVFPDVQLVITGHGEEQYFRSLANKLGLTRNVIWTGVLSDKDLAAIHYLCDLIILPPVPYILQSKFFDALYAGIIPIVFYGSHDAIRILGRDDLVYDGTDDSLFEVCCRILQDLRSYKAWVALKKSEVATFVQKTRLAMMHALALPGREEKG